MLLRKALGSVCWEGMDMAHTAPLPGQVLHAMGAAFGWQCHALPSWHDCAHTVLSVVRGSLGSAKGWPRGALPWAGAPFPCVCPRSWGCHEPPTHPVTV